MPRNKGLPDYSAANFGRRHEYFTEKMAKQLAEIFSFKHGFGLHEKLNDAAEWLDIFHNRGDESPRVQKQELEELQKRADALRESLGCLGRHAQVAILMNDPKVSQGQVDLSRLKISLQILGWATKNAIEGLPEARKGAPPKDLEALYSACLREIYIDGTGRHDTPKHDRGNDTYSGNFFEFFKACMAEVGLVKSDEQLSRLAGEACRKTSKVRGQ